MQSRADGRDRRPENGAHLDVGQPVEIAQDNRLPQRDREARQSATYLITGFRVQQTLVRTRTTGAPRDGVLHRDEPCELPVTAEPAAADISRDSI